MTETELRQLIAIKAQLQAADATIDALLGVAAGGCAHPRKTSTSTMTDPQQWYCPDCGVTGGRTVIPTPPKEAHDA